jgi:hypothetical protein
MQVNVSTTRVSNTHPHAPGDASRSSSSTSIAEAQRPTFSAGHMPVDSSRRPDAQHAPQSEVQAHPGMGVFDRAAFSPEFSKCFSEVRRCITSAEDVAHHADTGTHLPETLQAVSRLNEVVAQKMGQPRVAYGVAGSGELSEAERHAWSDFLRANPQLPRFAALPAAAPRTWAPVGENELRRVLADDAGFGFVLNTPDGDAFVRQLLQAVNDKTANAMRQRDNGMALVLRFDNTYNVAGHIALASLWRDGDGMLHMGIAHQESVPGTPQSGGVYTGRVHGELDTSATYPRGRAPVVESMKLSGPPSVNVFPCPYPDRIAGAVEELAGEDKAHPYGASNRFLNEKNESDWGPKGTLPADRRYENCFDVTHKVLVQLYGLHSEESHELFPDILNAMSTFASFRGGEFDKIEAGQGASRKAIDLHNLKKGEALPAFLHIAPRWGLSTAWHVPKTTTSKEIAVEVKPGQVGIALPGSARAMKFYPSAPKGLELDGKPVEGGDKTYSAQEAARMVYAGKEPGKAKAVVTFPDTSAPAKL